MSKETGIGRRPTAASSEYIDFEIARLRAFGLEELRARWRTVFRRTAPANLPRHLLFAIVAYQLQAEALGALDTETIRFLKQMDQALSKAAAVPLTQAFEQRNRQLCPGTVLSREWNGHHHRVMVLEHGFAWAGRTYKSLSEVAKAITGTKWNGPRFFACATRGRMRPKDDGRL